MGWSSGSSLFEKLIASVEYNISDFDQRYEVYTDMIGEFEDMDCDTLEECLGLADAFDAAWKDRPVNISFESDWPDE